MWEREKEECYSLFVDGGSTALWLRREEELISSGKGPFFDHSTLNLNSGVAGHCVWFLTCTLMLMRVTTQGGYTNTLRESAVQVGIPCHTGELNWLLVGSTTPATSFSIMINCSQFSASCFRLYQQSLPQQEAAWSDVSQYSPQSDTWLP